MDEKVQEAAQEGAAAGQGMQPDVLLCGGVPLVSNMGTGRAQQKHLSAARCLMDRRERVPGQAPAAVCCCKGRGGDVSVECHRVGAGCLHQLLQQGDDAWRLGSVQGEVGVQGAPIHDLVLLPAARPAEVEAEGSEHVQHLKAAQQGCQGDAAWIGWQLTVHAGMFT